MSREIKFRAWTGKRFWYFDISSGFNNENADTFGEPEQFTGLKDKNGTEIYEGDIVVTNDEFERIGYPVLWDDCGFWAIGGGYDAPLCDLSGNEHIEIIGNIHEDKKQ